MSWLRSTSWFARVVLPVDLLAVAAIVGALNYPVFRLKVVDVAYIDGREVTPKMHEQVRRAVHLDADSNLFSVATELVARLLLHDDDLAKVDVRLKLPDCLQVRLAAARPTLWWAQGREVTAVAGDGRPVAASEGGSFPVGSGPNSADSTLVRWRLLDLYHRLIRHDSRWAEVIAQISLDSVLGWELVLNGDGEHIILGQEGTTETFDRVTRFLECIPEQDWKHTTIDARFRERIVLSPLADSSDTGKVTVRTAGRDSTTSSSGGRS